MDKILVTYASRTGSTAGIAAAIGKVLAEGGAAVEVRPVCEIRDLTPYYAIVAGSAIQAQQWLPEAMEFVRAHRTELSRKPFAAFLVCMTLAIPRSDYRRQVAEWMQPVRSLTQPISEGLFAGALDIDKIPSLHNRLKFKMSVAVGVWSEGDHRNWNAVAAWAEGLRPRLLP